MSEPPWQHGTEYAPGAAGSPAVAPGAGQPAANALAIRGVVRDSLGVALPRAVVTLAASGGRQVEKTRSALDGSFEVLAPEHGEYLLSAFSPQLGDQSILVQLDGRVVEVEFRITVPGTVAE